VLHQQRCRPALQREMYASEIICISWFVELVDSTIHSLRTLPRCRRSGRRRSPCGTAAACAMVSRDVIKPKGNPDAAVGIQKSHSQAHAAHLLHVAVGPPQAFLKRLHVARRHGCVACRLLRRHASYCNQRCEIGFDSLLPGLLSGEAETCKASNWKQLQDEFGSRRRGIDSVVFN